VTGGAEAEGIMLGRFIQDAINPFAPVQFGPGAMDARHLATVTAVVTLAGGVQVAPILYLRSALPVGTTEGLDLNNDFTNNDLPARAFAYDGDGNAPKDMGPCEKVDCGRGAPFSQMNVRVSKRFVTSNRVHIDAIASMISQCCVSQKWK